MQPHNPTHAALLERILVGELSPTAHEARALLESCVPCRDRLHELLLLQGRLSEAGLEERAGIAQAAAGTLDPDGERRIQEFVAARAQRARRISRLGRLVTLAVAASLCGLIAYRWTHPARPEHPRSGPDGVLLHGERGVLRAVSPKDSTAAFDDFTWTSPPLEPDEFFRLQVTNLDAPDSDPLVIANIVSASWRRDSAGVAEARRVEDFFARSPRNIEWQVEICKQNRQTVLTSDTLRASLR
jgi:hypothetical protein